MRHKHVSVSGIHNSLNLRHDMVRNIHLFLLGGCGGSGCVLHDGKLLSQGMPCSVLILLLKAGKSTGKAEPSLQPSPQLESPFPKPPLSIFSPTNQGFPPEKVAHSACLSIDLLKHTSQHNLLWSFYAWYAFAMCISYSVPPEGKIPLGQGRGEGSIIFAIPAVVCPAFWGTCAWWAEVM